MNKPRLILFACLLLLLNACATLTGAQYLATQTPIAPLPPVFETPIQLSAMPPTAIPETPVLPTAIPPTSVPQFELSEALLRNMTYQSSYFNIPITLQDGHYRYADDMSVQTVDMLSEIAFGDLNGDGLNDAVVLLGENGGGSGTFVSLVAILNQNGQAVQAGSIMVDDRPRINSLSISNGQIMLDGFIHSLSDFLANPTLAVMLTYHLDDNGLQLLSQTTPTPGGGVHAITITSPAWGEHVAGSLRVVGEMPIGPFENTILYQLVDAAGNVLDSSGFMVQSDGAGGPATFDNTINLPALSSGQVVWLELKELSMADGTPIAVARVKLVIE
jgi:hypothetical protein